MSESNIVTLALGLFAGAGESVRIAAQQGPAAFGPVIAAGLATIIFPIAIGFGAAGPVAGTLAAAWQASIGNVAIGSLFATAQSLTMSGAFVKLGGVLIAVGVAGLAGAGQLVGREGWRRTEGVRSVEWIGKEMWKKTQAGVTIADWEGVAQGVKQAGKETWKKAEERIRNAVSKKVVQRGGWITKGAWMGKEAWKGTEKGMRSANWEWVTQGAKWAGMETWKKAGEGIRNVVPKKVVQREGWLGKGAWKGTEKGASAKWEWVTQGGKWAGIEIWKKAGGGIRNAIPKKVVQREGWLGNGAWKGTEKGASAKWQWVVQEAKRAKKETWKKTEKGVRGADWYGMGQGIQRALNWW